MVEIKKDSTELLRQSAYLHQREIVVNALTDLPQASVATDVEVLHFIDRRALFGRGIGYVDAHLLAAVQLTAAELWTKDKRLHDVADRLGLAFMPPPQT